jgi:hypothetical protein
MSIQGHSVPTPWNPEIAFADLIVDAKLLYNITNSGGRSERPLAEGQMPKLKLPNIDDVVAIDIHTHAEEPCGLHGDDGYDDFQAQMAAYFKSPNQHPPTVAETAAYYRAKKIAAVIFPVDAERETGFRRYNNDEMIEAASDNLDVLIPFASIDPHKGKLGVREAKRLIEDFGVKGFKFHPTMQGFYPNDRLAYPLYEAISDGGAIALFHTGQTGVGSGMPGGMGMRLKYSNPMHMDDVAVDFPDLKIILAPPFPGRRRRCRSRPTSRTSISTSPAGRRNISRRSWCATSTRSCRTRCCSAPTGR